MIKRRLTWIFFTSIFLLLLANIANRVFYFKSILPIGDQFFTIACEGFTTYSTWKAMHGYPLYEWPQRDWYSLSLYNWLFYRTYAFICLCCHADGIRITQIGRIITMFFAGVGALTMLDLVRSILRSLQLKPNYFIIGACTLLFWFGAGLVGDWGYTFRCDVSALAIALVGFRLFLLSIPDRSWLFVLSGVVFYAAWCFKQPVIALFVSCSIYAFLAFSRKRTALFIISFGFPLTINLMLGGAAYRYNILYAPSISPFVFENFRIYGRWVFVNGVFVFGCIPYLPNLIKWRHLQRMDFKSMGGHPPGTQYLLILLIAAVVAGLMDITMFAKAGSANNMLFEMLAVLTMLAMISFHHLLDTESPHKNKWLILFSLCFLYSFATTVDATLKYRRGKMGHALLVSQNDYESRVLFGHWLQTLQVPVFIRDSLFAMPWYANDNHYPAIIFDPIFHGRAAALGLLEGGGVESLVRKRYFATLLLAADDKLIRVSMESGYAEVPIPEDRRFFRSCESSEMIGPLVLLVRR